ncbi:Protein eyes shut [Manis javanica]|nr:Protein eyes shut [Manis javanica]
MTILIGLLCEINKKKCDLSLCLHNRTSPELMDKFKCICPPSFIATNPSSTAYTGGNLLGPEGGHRGGRTLMMHFLNYNVFREHCLTRGENPGYAGLRCEQDIDDCILNACEHNSTCQDLHLSYQCVPLSGLEGNFCEQESNDCKMNPCKNNSTCTDLYNSYRCECTPPGWTGQNCTEERNECDSDPCMNGALCHESTIPGQFVCLCPPFFTGKFCHQHYNVCDPLDDPCRNNSTCLTLVDGNHYCLCREGFEGEHCEINMNECFSFPCQNYGDCKDGVNNFSLCLGRAYQAPLGWCLRH